MQSNEEQAAHNDLWGQPTDWQPRTAKERNAMAYDSRPDTWEHINKVRQYLDGAVRRLMDRGDRHDRTKLESPEREMFDEFTPKLREVEYGSPEYKACTSAMGEALKHHYAHNSHHPEHYQSGISGMSLLDLVEMLCDWKAAGERHADGGNIRRSLDMNIDRFEIGSQLEHILNNTIEEMGW